MIIASLEDSQPFINLVYIILGFFVVTLIISQVKSFIAIYYDFWGKTFYRMNLSNIMSSKFMRFNYHYISSHKGQQDMENAKQAQNSGLKGVERSARTLEQLLINLLGIVAFSAVLATLNLWIILILIACGVISLLLGKHVNKYRERFRGDTSKLEARRRNTAAFINNTKYAKDIRLYSMAGFIIDKYRGFLVKRKGIERKTSTRKWLMDVLETLIVFIKDGFAYLFLIYMVTNGRIGVSDFILYTGAVTGFSVWVSGIVQSVITLHKDCLDIERFRVIFDKKTESGTKKAIDIKGKAPYTIEFRNVSFSYDDKKIFDDFSFTFNAGKKIALVGENGAGKTTLVMLMLNLLKPDSGEILINGININEFINDEYFSLYSVSFQDALITAFSFRHNITMKTKDKTDEDKLKKSIELAGLGKKVDSLEKGIDTPLLKAMSDDGIELSGGEKQRVYLARALYKDAPFLILDEPTSALDPIAENRMYKEYHKMAKDKTALFISHRLASTQFCDEIVLLKDGKIVEYGTHEKLLKDNALYTHMFDVQSQ